METIQSDSPKKVFIETWGCQMNVADSEQMLGLLRAQNYTQTDKPEDADLVLLNTCHIREKATHKVLSRLGRMREISLEFNPKMKIAVAGCVAQAEGKKLMEKASNIDILLGPGKIQELPGLLAAHAADGKRAMAIGFEKHVVDSHRHDPAPELAVKTEVETPYVTNPTVTMKEEITRFVNIAQGCDNFCTFCVVPFTRGREISRPLESIVSEVKTLLTEGAKEITLLGQNVNSYGDDLVRDGKHVAPADGPFVELLDRVAQIPGVERLRFTTSNPHDFTKPVAEMFRKHKNLGRYIHLPVQAGHDDVLERMKRKVTVAQYMERIQWLRDIDPEMALSTDLIVGFPGETEDEFQGTLDLVEKVRYSFIYAFKYSSRKGTAAARFKDQVPEAVMHERLLRLQALQNRITTELNVAEIGNRREVLCHYASRKEPDVYYGRTEQFRLVKITSTRNLVGKTLTVDIVEANKTALVGVIV
ncbi:MAG: tRNA (N6-isopentenyl adenosine(37)-C2)-methylthiotransferase MiaB [Chitinophagaceae bacterium]|nr:tRNA (N6-isopentenyl adenosine(37)-C2)-methylthiotransferase MiaB [Oligoflexus sp.]